ncbi:MAG: Gfo/Idh/MocA family oxidoreductase [Candidatus Accumulibacter sp.]|jgi:predicted dehydrogenase|nr:Gfo/Idh/MocA family oxidoreductase [Accumulibacter sp.]
MTREVRYGIIGAGTIAGFHAEAIKSVENARLTAVCDSDGERAAEFARARGIECHANLADFLARAPIDAVTIATPTGLHAEVAIPAARAGKHVLCEKPLDVTAEKAQAIIDACGKAGVLLVPVFQNRFGHGAVRIKRAIEAGRFGRLLQIGGRIKWYRSQEYYDSGAWRGTWALDGGGCLMNQSIHTVDLMLHFGGRPEQVFGYTATRTHTGLEVEDNACAVLRFRNGAIGVIESSTSCAPGFPARIEVSGERGTAALEGDAIVQWSFTDSEAGDEAILAGIGQTTLGSGASDPKAIGVEGHRLQIADMTRAILTGGKPAIDGAEARIPVELVCGIYESMKTGKPYVFKE